MRRVVVTGLGMVSPLGGDIETSWKNILASKSGATRITRFDPTDYSCQIACEVKPPEHEYGFDPAKRVDHKIQRQVDPFIVYGLDAAGQAIEDAGLTDMSEEERYRAGVSIGSGIGGLPGIEKEAIVLHEKGPRRVSPHFVHGRLINLISGQVSIRYGLMGPNHAVVTACSTGAHSIGDAARMIAMDDADVMLGGAGAVEAIFCILALRDQIVPPTLNLDNPSEGTAGVDLVPHVAKERKVRAVLNNSFGFGGTNASLIMKAV